MNISPKVNVKARLEFELAYLDGFESLYLSDVV